MKKITVALAALIIGAALLFAQVPVDTGHILLESENPVGEVYRGPGDPAATIYNEHWVLHPGYVYPGPKTLVTLKVVPQAKTPYSSEEDFFRRAAFPKGSKYVKVTAEEFTKLP